MTWRFPRKGLVTMMGEGRIHEAVSHAADAVKGAVSKLGGTDEVEPRTAVEPAARVDDLEPNLSEVRPEEGNRSGIYDTAGDTRDHT